MRRCSSIMDMFESEDAFVRDQHTSTDLISMLPDELLVHILSFLTLKESAATSLLSRRWVHLWTHTPKLNFDGQSSLRSLYNFSISEHFRKAYTEERLTTYVRWVDHVIALHNKCCAIEDFRVCFSLNKPYQKYIDNWVIYALTRKVKRLELDLADMLCSVYPSTANCCTFPYEILRRYKENCCNDSQLHGSIYFKYLEKICMKYVNVNGEALEFLLSNCPLLQHLSVCKSEELSKLKIVGPFPCFRRLEIILCTNLKSFEIRDANLVSLKYTGRSVQHFVLMNVPLLVEIYLSGLRDMNDVVLMFSSILTQIEKFDFDFARTTLSWKVTEVLYLGLKMNNLKQLALRPLILDTLLPITNILRSSPCLQTLVLEITSERTTAKRELVKIEGSYIHLKEVKIRGYCGSVAEVELVMHLWESAGALEKIVIDPRDPDVDIKYFYGRYSDVYRCREINGRTRAREQLLDILPPTINLQIL